MTTKSDNKAIFDSISSNSEGPSQRCPSSSQGLLLEDYTSSVKESDSIAIPAESKECSWKDYLAVASCLVSFGAAISVVFVQKWAVYWNQNGQFILVGLCLTVMSWCTQLFVRRLFLVASIHFRPSSSLQTLDAILRSDPLTSNANWTSRISLVCMLAIAPALSAAYKSLGGGESSFTGNGRSVQIGLTGPPGTQNLGYGLSQFVNATLPWFEQPGLGRSYGFNSYVLNENTTAMLDGPMPGDFQIIQASLGPRQWMTLTGDVSAIVCSLNPDLNYERTKLTDDFKSQNNGQGDAAQMWVWNGYWNKGIFLPNKINNMNVYFSAYNSTANQTFGENARHYELIRQNYTATWHITASSIRLEAAAPKENQVLDDQGIFTNTFVSLPELFITALVEYDAVYRKFGPGKIADDFLIYQKEIKTAATPLAGAVWARFVAWLGPETWSSTSQQGLSEEQASTLLYSRLMSNRKGAVTIKRGWQIILVLLINPLLLLASFLFRVTKWPGSPIGGGFGVVSLLASVDKDCRRLLDGAGLSGKLKRPLSVMFDVRGTSTERLENVPQRAQARDEGRITTFLGTSRGLRSGRLKRGALYW